MIYLDLMSNSYIISLPNNTDFEYNGYMYTSHI